MKHSFILQALSNKNNDSKYIFKIVWITADLN